MQKLYKRKFALSDQGAGDLTKATFYCFIVFMINMFPAIILMLFADHVLLGHEHTSWTYWLITGFTLILMYLFLALEYDALYSTTYRESANLRKNMANTLAELPLSYFSKRNLSDLAQTIMSDVEALEHAISHAIAKTYALMIFFPVIAVLLLLGNIKLGLAVIIPTTCSLLLVPLSKKLQVRANQRFYDVLRNNAEAFQETIECQQEIKSFNLMHGIKKTLNRQMEETEKIHLKVESYPLIAMSLSSLFSYLGVAVVVLIGTQLLIQAEISFLYLMGYLLAAIKINDAIVLCKETLLETYYIAPRINRIREIYETTKQEGQDIQLKTHGISLEHVGFAYQKDAPVLKDISFTAEQGEVTALVGASGSGKSTLLKVISRLYDYDTGHIYIGGHDIKTISTTSLFEQISVVFQDVTLFNTSIMENIRLGRRDASDDEVLEAARQANCLSFINEMPDGIHTTIGENGAQLSGGQRQRISIARSFLKNAPILILDEIASSLDIENEHHIQESLTHLIADKTVIIISHRLRSIAKADKIVVLDQGMVESEGSHEWLLTHSPIYRNLIEKTTLAENFIY